MEERVVRIVMLEDEDDDALLVERELQRSGINVRIKRVAARAPFEAALRETTPDLILSDNSLPAGFTGTEALGIAAELAAQVPFIFVSGTIGEEAAIEALKRGATDYVLKDKLSRLIPVVQRALREARERREHERLEQEFLQAQKMESLGRMAGSIAHDFNNLLTVLGGNAELIAGSPSATADTRRYSVEMQKAVERGKHLTGRLLAFSRRQPVESREFDLNAQWREFSTMAASLLGSGIRVREELHASPLRIKADPGQIDQVLMNLLVNARDAMPHGGEIKVTTARVEAGAPGQPALPLVPVGAYAVLVVTDSGTGMTSEVKARMFEPFFTTKEAGKGTGLGLATVYGIVKQSGGTVWVDSEPGHGSAFNILLPLAAGAAGPEAAAVLLVDDEDGVRGYVAQALEAVGHRAVAARSAEEALAAFEGNPGGFSLLLTDVMLGGMDGIELARRARAIRPELPVIFASGLASALGRAKAEISGAICLEKPFGVAELARRVREALGTSS